nr:MAG TPA: hypothetical protein [Caudoviricetes sp.]
MKDSKERGYVLVFLYFTLLIFFSVRYKFMKIYLIFSF